MMPETGLIISNRGWWWFLIKGIFFVITGIVINLIQLLLFAQGDDGNAGCALGDADTASILRRCLGEF